MVRHAHRPVAGVARRSAPLLLSFALGLFAASCGSSTSAEQPIGPDAGDRTTADAQGDAHDAVTEDASGGATDVGEADDAGEADAAGDTADTSAPEPGLELEPGEAPFDLPAGAVFYPDVTYGPHGERSLLDVLVPDSETPPPLVVFIHGGGFTSGSKEKLYENDATNARAFLERGVAVAAINYRYLGAAEGVLGCMNDSRYALQFLRYHQDAFGFDASRVVLYGGSAGAGTSLWIGAGDEMADPDAEDPVERMSTRVSAVSLAGTQATYDLRRWETDVFVDFGITLELAISVASQLVPTLQRFYGLDELSAEETLAALDEPDIVAYRAAADMLAMIDASDPPIRITSGGPTALPTNQNTLFHHPYHGREIREAALAAGVDVVVSLPGMEIVDEGFPTLVDFAVDALFAAP